MDFTSEIYLEMKNNDGEKYLLGNGIACENNL